MVGTAIVHPGKLVKENILAEEKAQRFRDSAQYWEDSYKDLTARYDDIDHRLKVTRLEIMSMQLEMKEVRIQAERRKDAMIRLSQDREAAIYHIGVLEEALVDSGADVPERPNFQSSGYDITQPDSLGA